MLWKQIITTTVHIYIYIDVYKRQVLLDSKDYMLG